MEETKDEVPEIEKPEVTELTEGDLEDASGGGETNINCPCNSNQ